MSLLEYLYSRIKEAFEKRPYQFFTEHDIHSEISRISNKYLGQQSAEYGKTLDGYFVKRVHHEYPTPFRCLMPDDKFSIILESEYQKIREKRPGFRARRGWLDLVILNPEYIETNEYQIVTGKNYNMFREKLETRQPSALDLAIEIVHFNPQSFSISPGRVRNTIGYARQDYQKICAVADFRFDENVPFCKEAAMLYFASTEHKERLKAGLNRIKTIKDVPLLTIGL